MRAGCDEEGMRATTGCDDVGACVTVGTFLALGFFALGFFFCELGRGRSEVLAEMPPLPNSQEPSSSSGPSSFWGPPSWRACT